MKNNFYSLILLLAIILFYNSCNCDDCLRNNNYKEPTAYDYQLGTHFKDIGDLFDNTPANNPTTYEGVELGRHLFYDKRLSVNNTISCATCHKQEYAFTDPRKLSIGFEGESTTRNSMSIVNMRWQQRFFWDARETSLEQQVLTPIQDHIEMGMTLDKAVKTLSKIKIYKELFGNAFGDSEVTTERISFALAQFVRSIVSQNSKYDLTYGMPEGRIKKELSAQEYLGYKLFTTHVAPDNYTGDNDPGKITRGANCDDCHNGQLITDNRISNNGLDLIYADKGFGDISNKTKYNGTFKTPTLRNIELTAPYMHDGRFKTLEEVIDHYDQHVKRHKNLDKEISEAGNHRIMKLDLTQNEKDALIAFLKTFTDHQLINDPKYANPF
ncbi:MAG: cytochrome-c peroxidase [Bacteroidia bacterium]